MQIEIIEKIKRLPKQSEESLNDAFSLLVDVEDRKSVDEYVKWIRSEAYKLRSVGAYDLIKRTYIYAARYSFDDYMVAMEWDREPQARFWIPRRRILEGKHKLASQIQEFLDDDESRLLSISLPPGTGKTTLIKFLLSYIAGSDPNGQSMYISYSDGMVKMMLDSLKAMTTDTFEYRFNDIFPGLGEPDISSEYKTISYRRKGDFPTVGLVSLGGSVTGRTRANRFMVTDDLVANKEMARSPERLAKLFEDYTATLTTRKIGDKVKEIMLGTIWSSHDPISRMKVKYADNPQYKFIAIPVWDENKVSNFEYDHPDRYTTEKIKEIEKSLDPVDFSCLYLQRGIDKEGLAFANLKFYNGVLPDGEPDNIVFATDIAWGGGDSLSMPIAYVYGEDVYIHDVVFDKGDKTKTKPRVMGKILHHRCKMGRMEANNGGDEYCDDIHKMLKENGYSINITHKKAPTNQSKLARIEQHAPTIRSFYFRSESCRDAEYDKFMTELMTFSFTSKNLHDDAPDSMAMLVDFMYGGGIKSVRTARRPF